MTTIERIIDNVLTKINDKRYYYSQKRENAFATDCSDIILRSIREANIEHSATYTGNMITGLTSTGKFKAISFDISKAQRGDIFLRHEYSNIGHTVLYLGNNKIAEACSSKIGLRVTTYYFNRYQYIIRYIGSDDNTEVSKMPLLKYGSQGIYVCLLQVFLNKYFNSHLIVDGDFKNKTKEAVINAQIKLGTDPDGEVGQKTWTKIYFTMVTN